MTILQLTMQTLTKSMPSIFDNKNSIWPYPEQSIGEECSIISGLRCWLPIGPALAAFEVLAKEIQDLLDKHKDALMQGEPKPRAISFNMWMTGCKPEASSPTIVFSSKSPRQRLFAKALLKDSKLLDQYPGVRIKTLDRMPAIYQAGSQEPDTMETTRDSTENGPNDGSEEAIYMVDDSRGSCGALIAFGHSRLATMGGILRINGTYYGISAQHGRYEFFEELEDSTNEANSLCFDDDSDAEDSDLDNLIEITSRESISSYSDEGSSTLSFASTTSPKDRIFEYPSNIPGTTEIPLDHTTEVPSPSQPTYSSNPKISKLLPFERNDLDYEVFEIDDPRYHSWNIIDLPSSRHPVRHILPNEIVRTLVECPVWAATGTTGCVQGTMMRQAHYIKMEGSETFQEMWAVKLDRNTKPGDSGAWVVDSAGQLFGHIVAGDPVLGLAFIIPAYKVFDDIKRRFGSEALCCPSSSTMQPYNTLNNNVSRYDLSAGIEQTCAPSRLFGWSGDQNLGPTHRTFSMVLVLLSVSLYLPLALHEIVFIGLGGEITYSTLQAAAEIAFVSPLSHDLPLADYGMVFIRLGGVGLGTYSTLQTASEILSLPLHLPYAKGSIMSICLLQWVALVITYTRGIVPMRTYMSIQSGAEYPLAAIKIRDGHELQTGGIWSFISLLSAFSASNPALYVVSRAHKRHVFSQHERNARLWNSRHITSHDLAQALLTRLLQLMFWNDNAEWQRIAHGGRHARTNMYLACWAEQYLQKLEQEVLHRRAGFCRGDLLSTSMINTGTSKQLMAAAFDASEFSAKTPSFGSMVPSIGSYTYLGYNVGTAADAAAYRIGEVHKTVDQPPVMIIGIGASDDVPLSLWDFLEPVSTYDSIAMWLGCRPIYNDAHDSALSYDLPSAYPPNLIKGWCSSDEDSVLPTRFIRRRRSYARLEPHRLSQHRGICRTTGDRKDKRLLKCAFHFVGCPREFGLTQETQWLAHLSTHFHTRLSAPLNVQRLQAMRQADSADLFSILLFCLRMNHNPYGNIFDYLEHWPKIDDLSSLWNSLGIAEPVTEQIECWNCYYWVLLLSGFSFGAIPNHDARQLRRRRLNAPRRREDNSQCSESRERERQ